MRWPPPRWIRAAFALIAPFFLLAVVILAGSMIPANRGWTPPRSGVTIYVYTNGVHTGLVLPAVNPLHDWRGRIRASDLPDPRRAGSWLIFGWGQRDFYLNTPRWSDVRIGTALRAMIGSDRTLVHVDHIRRVWNGRDLRPILLTGYQYLRLTRLLESDFAPGAAIRGYAADDVFYPGRGRYNAVTTCNEWTGAKLRAIGVRIGVWTPTASGVMRWFPAPTKER
ncbi:MAG: TIGR02117 family protein [Sphingobium phenoxybenzoativorans]